MERESDASEQDNHELARPADLERRLLKKVVVKMIPLTAVAVYRLAQFTEYLRRVKNYDVVVYEDGSYEKYGQKLILSSMLALENELNRYQLAKPEAEALSALSRDFQNKYCRAKPNIEDADAKKLVLIAERIEVAIRKEITRRNFGELTPVQGMLNYNRLLSEGLPSLLGDTAWKVPKIVKQDLEEAIKCLSYGAPTASVMIGLRAVEGMLGEVHTSLTGDKSRKVWKQLLEGIRQDLKTKGIENSPLFGYLDYVRDVRNKADHPDRTFTLREAEELFMHAIHIIREVEELGGIASSTL